MAMNDAQPAHFRLHRFPAEIIVRVVWLYFRFPLIRGPCRRSAGVHSITPQTQSTRAPFMKNVQELRLRSIETAPQTTPTVPSAAASPRPLMRQPNVSIDGLLRNGDRN